MKLEKTGRNDLITVYSAIWKDGPKYSRNVNYTRDSNKKVVLICLQNSTNSIKFVINEV
jgi:hypothetical protein